jgi:hypothetical protein
MRYAQRDRLHERADDTQVVGPEQWANALDHLFDSMLVEVEQLGLRDFGPWHSSVSRCDGAQPLAEVLD